MPTSTLYSGLIERCQLVGVGRLLHLLGIRIGQERHVLGALQRFERLLAAMEHEDRPLPPVDDDLGAFLDLAETSRSTGPPAASVEASGFIWSISGTKAAAAPTAPMAAVAI